METYICGNTHCNFFRKTQKYEHVIFSQLDLQIYGTPGKDGVRCSAHVDKWILKFRWEGRRLIWQSSCWKGAQVVDTTRPSKMPMGLHLVEGGTQSWDRAQCPQTIPRRTVPLFLHKAAGLL